MVHAVRNVGHIYIPLSENLSDDLVRVKQSDKSYVLLICPTFRYTTLCERIEHYTARIDYNQDLFIYPFLNILS